MKLVQKTKYKGDGYWVWSVWLDGSKAELARVIKVRYLLHPTFNPPTRWAEDPSNKFRLDCTGWGGFTIRADVFFTNKKTRRLSHDLKLEYPAASRKKTSSSRRSKRSGSSKHKPETPGEPIDTTNWLASQGTEEALEATAEGATAGRQNGHITFIHGIANKASSEALLKSWVDALAANDGINLEAMGVSVSMIYWADVLYSESLTDAVVSEESAAPGKEAEPERSPEWQRGLPRDERFFVAAVESDIQSAATSATIELKAAVEAKAKRPIRNIWPISALMARLLRDMHHYLFNAEFSPRPGVSYHVQDETRRRFVEALKKVTPTNREGKQPHIVVSYSTGAVVAYDCLTRVSECPAVDGFMTIGSPLGLEEIKDALRPQWASDTSFPDTVRGQWINIYDLHDPVCGSDPRLADDYLRDGEKGIQDIEQQNSGMWRHSIEKYLNGPLLRSALQQLLSAPVQVIPTITEGAHQTWSLPSIATAIANPASATEVPVATESTTAADNQQPPAPVSQPPATGVQFSSTAFLSQLKEALDSFRHERVKQLCNEIVGRLLSHRVVLSLTDAENILGQLRRKRKFSLMRNVADALIQTGHDAPKIRRLYVQSLLDEGDVAAGLTLAEALIAAKPDDDSEVAELEGLIGRGYKQWYVESKNPDWLKRSLASYYPRFAANPAEHSWHGINVVDLLARAERDRIDVGDWPPYAKLAEQVLATVTARIEKGNSGCWDFATAMDACIALGRTNDAVRWAREYVECKESDAFDLASTIRQLKEIWQLTPDHEPGNVILPLLQASLLTQEGAELTLDPAIPIATRMTAAVQSDNLQRVLGFDAYQPIKWWLTALKRSRSVARMETEMGQAVGTGFVVKGRDLNPRLGDELLLLTNAHVLGKEPSATSPLSESRAIADFQYSDNASDRYCRLGRILASSQYKEFDFTLAQFEGAPPAVASLPIDVTEPNSDIRRRLNAIGYPKGGDLSLSIRDNLLIDFASPRLQYRTPTNPGSSGSPIFDDQWNLIALHHAGGKEMPKLHGEGTHEANEGIWIKAILEEIERQLAGKSATATEGTPPIVASNLKSRSIVPPPRRPAISSGGATMNLNGKHARLESFLRGIAGGDRLEALRAEAPWERAEESLASMAGPLGPQPTPQDAQRAVEKMQTGATLTDVELASVEAIVLPKERPVVFIDNNTFEVPESPWEHFANGDIRRRIEAAIPSVGRVELPNNLSIPFGGTAFVVGPDLLMTNRHVAELFASGLGQRSVTFRTGQSAGWDFLRERHSLPDGGTQLEVQQIVMIHPYWDMALLRVVGLTADHPALKLAIAPPEALVDREIAVIGYPAKDWRNDSDLQDRIFRRVYNVKRLQPGKIKPRGAIRSFENDVSAMTHDSSTLGGNSGSVLIDVTTGEAVGLHFAGRYLEANYAVPTYELARDPRVADLGVTFVGTVPASSSLTNFWRRIEPQEATLPKPAQQPGPSLTPVQAMPSTSRLDGGILQLTIPLQISVALPQAGRESVLPGASGAEALLESLKSPVIFPRLDRREGYDPEFLELGSNMAIPLPALTSKGKKVAARLDDDSNELKYHKFSLVMHKTRRLALFTAANVDWRDQMRKVNGKKPTRRELTGLPEGAAEKWQTDDRIPENQQLPDMFFTQDGKAFDKGHLVRRDDVCWGKSFKDIQMANGDTYHTTNCSPQVAGFNQSTKGEDNWGDLENLVQSETGAEKVMLFSGPVLSDDDLFFNGVDERGDVQIQIPSKFWKIIVAKGDEGPEAFGFVLEQDLSDVPLELVIPTRWLRYMKPIAEIEELLFDLVSLDFLKPFDQIASHRGRRLQTRARR